MTGLMTRFGLVRLTGKVPLVLRHAVLVRADDPPVEEMEPRGDDFEEVLEHVIAWKKCTPGSTFVPGK